jgi:hypothetical protein
MAALAAEVYVSERDSRCMNNMDPDTKLVHARLEEWSRWAKDLGIAGYPRQSLTEKAAQYGKLGIPQESNIRSEPMMPDHVARMDAAICRLGDVDRKAIKLYYLNWDVAENLARKMDRSMRRAQFLNVVRRARWRLGAFLDAIENSL